MEKYRVKVKNPMYSGLLNTTEDGIFQSSLGSFRPRDYPDMFEKVEDPIVKTYDGVEVYDRHQDLFFVDESFEIEPNIYDRYLTAIWFDDRKNAEKYVELNKPKFSEKDILKLAEELMPSKKIMKLLDALKIDI